MQTGQSLTRDQPRSERPRVQLRMFNHWDNLNGTIERGYAGRSLYSGPTARTVSPGMPTMPGANASIGINGVTINNFNVRAVRMPGC